MPGALSSLFLFLALSWTCLSLARPIACFEAQALQRLFSTQLQFRTDALPISSYLKITGIEKFRDPDGMELGEALRIEVISVNVKSLAEGRDGLQKYRTEMNDHNRSLFERLGFLEGHDAIYGKYMSRIPSPQLFESLRARYNSTAPENLQIHMGIYQSQVLSAKQTEFVTNWVESGLVALGDARFGSFFGLKPEELAVSVANGKENNSVFRHDLEHFGSLVLMPKPIVERNRLLGKFWLKVIRHLKIEVSEGRIDRHSQDWHDIMNVVYIYARRFHSLTHVLGMLAREGGAIDINQQRLLDFGSVARSETPAVHWVGLGFRPDSVTVNDLPKANRHMYELGLNLSKPVTQAIRISDVYRQVTNEEQALIRNFSQNPPIPGYQKVYLEFLHDLGLHDLPPLSESDLESLQSLTLLRHQKM
jgi:hypothetical protein